MQYPRNGLSMHIDLSFFGLLFLIDGDLHAPLSLFISLITKTTKCNTLQIKVKWTCAHSSSKNNSILLAEFVNNSGFCIALGGFNACKGHVKMSLRAEFVH